MSEVLLVDASILIFRAYFGMPTMRRPDGHESHAVYGFLSQMTKVLKKTPPSYGVCAFDESLTTSFRNEIYPEYKSTRELPPKELEAQLGACFEAAEALGFCCEKSPRFEADDIIGTASFSLRKKGLSTAIVSTDKDLCQLLLGNDDVLVHPKDGSRQSPKEALAKFNVRPSQIVSYLALAGDSVDNIPGVRGIGAKTAAALLSHYENIDAIYAHLDELGSLAQRGSGSWAKKLAADEDRARLSYRLATIVCDAPFDFSLENTRWEGVDIQKLEALCDVWSFGDTLRKRLRKLPRWQTEV